MNPSPEPRLERPWGEHDLPAGEDLAVSVGPLSLWARRRSDEVWLAHEPGDWLRSGDPPALDVPSDRDESWTRWPVRDGADRIRLVPALPPRPLVVKPEVSFRLLPRASARIYVSVPLWVRVTLAGSDGRTLTEVPTVALSDTWWGELSDGELGYWLPTSARRDVRPAPFPEHAAVCPLDLTNRSDDELEVQKIAVRVAHLSVFRGEAGFWSDLTRVRYRGVDEASEIEVTGQAPGEAGKARRVTEPRSPSGRRFSARTFSRLVALSGLGGL